MEKTTNDDDDETGQVNLNEQTIRIELGTTYL